MSAMNIMMWAGLCVLVAYNGNAELATLGVMLLTIMWAADEEPRGVGSSTSISHGVPRPPCRRRTPGPQVSMSLACGSVV